MKGIRNILLAVDFSSCSRAALKAGLELAAAVGASVELLHVVELPHHLSPELPVLAEPKTGRELALREFARSEAAKKLDIWLDEARERGVTATSRLEVGQPKAAIVAHSRRDEVDLLVMGTHGRTGLPHLVAGSVAEHVVRHAACSVLTVREPTYR